MRFGCCMTRRTAPRTAPRMEPRTRRARLQTRRDLRPSSFAQPKAVGVNRLRMGRLARGPHGLRLLNPRSCPNLSALAPHLRESPSLRDLSMGRSFSKQGAQCVEARLRRTFARAKQKRSLRALHARGSSQACVSSRADDVPALGDLRDSRDPGSGPAFMLPRVRRGAFRGPAVRQQSGRRHRGSRSMSSGDGAGARASCLDR